MGIYYPEGYRTMSLIELQTRQCPLTTDKTYPEFVFEKIRRSRQLYDIIKKASLDADKRSGVIHLE